MNTIKHQSKKRLNVEPLTDEVFNDIVDRIEKTETTNEISDIIDELGWMRLTKQDQHIIDNMIDKQMSYLVYANQVGSKFMFC